MKSPDWSTKNQIDYVLSKQLQIIQDVDVLNTISTGSDHRLVSTNVIINRKLERYKKVKQPIVTGTINREEIKNNFHEWDEMKSTKM